ncbi:MAG: hypothetical protein QM564_01450 [Bergeyella sp.]
MKKTILILGMAFAVNAVTISCETDDRSNELVENAETKGILSKEAVKNAPLAKQLQYKKYYLQEAGKIIKELGVPTDELINLAITAQGKGQQENTFLLKDVVSLAKSKKKNIDAGTLKRISELENAFNGLDDNTYNISIYIPFASKVQSSGQTNKDNEEKDDVFIFAEQEDYEQEYFEGYVLNEDGNYVSYEELINEEKAEEMAEDGRVVTIIGTQGSTLDPTDGNGGSGNGGGTQPANTNKQLRIGNMIVRDDNARESWIAGASEITIQMYKLENGNLQKISLITGSTNGGVSQCEFAEFKRKEIRNHTQKYLNATVAGMIETNPSVYNNSNFFYVIYESDNWPTDTHTVSFPYYLNGQQLQITYGSGNSGRVGTPYYDSNAHNNKIPTVVENSVIKFSPFFQ